MRCSFCLILLLFILLAEIICYNIYWEKAHYICVRCNKKFDYFKDIPLSKYYSMDFKCNKCRYEESKKEYEKDLNRGWPD